MALAQRRATPGLRFADSTPITAPRSTSHAGGAPRGDRTRVALAGETKASIEAAGIACPMVTGAGTGTWQLERDSGVYTELQPGSYVFMDVDYRTQRARARRAHFEQSLFVLATVMSAPAPERAVVDAGLKALAFDSGLPLVYGARGLEYVKASDEHGVIASRRTRSRRASATACGSIPGHCDPTVNLYDWIVGVRGDARRVRVAGRGARRARLTRARLDARRRRASHQIVTMPRGVRSIAARRGVAIVGDGERTVEPQRGERGAHRGGIGMRRRRAARATRSTRGSARPDARHVPLDQRRHDAPAGQRAVVGNRDAPAIVAARHRVHGAERDRARARRVARCRSCARPSG